MPGSSLIGSLAVTLGLNTAAFETGAKRAEARANTLKGRLQSVGDGMKGLALGLGAGIGIAAITGLAKNAFEMASALDESAQKVGLTVEALQELNLAATQNGISEEQLATALQRMNKNIGLLGEGSKPAVAAFAKIGLTFDDLKGKAPEVQLGIIADALNKLPTLQERVAVGAAIMGKGFSELLPLINQGSKGLEDWKQKAIEQGIITTEEAKKLDGLADTWDRLKIRLGVFAAKFIAMFAEIGDKGDIFLGKWENWRNGIIQSAEGLATGAVAALGKLAEGVRNAIVNGLGKVMDWAKTKIQEVGDKFKWLWDVTVGHSYIPDMVSGIGQSMKQLQELMVDPAKTAADKVAGVFSTLAGTVGNLFGSKAGGIIGAIGQFATALAPLFGGAKIPKIDLPAFGTPGNTPGFARGGSGVFGGIGGVDKNLISMNGSPIMRVSKGEHFRVGNDNASPSAKVLIVPTPYFDAHVQGQAAAVAAPMVGQGMVGAGAGAVNAINRKRERTLP
jgi:hypothetical protein